MDANVVSHARTKRGAAVEVGLAGHIGGSAVWSFEGIEWALVAVLCVMQSVGVLLSTI